MVVVRKFSAISSPKLCWACESEDQPMNFEYNEDQLVVKESVSKYLQDNYGFESRQKMVNSDKPFMCFPKLNVLPNTP